MYSGSMPPDEAYDLYENGLPFPLPPGIQGSEPTWIAPDDMQEPPLYTAGFLRTQIGRLMRVEFLMGNSLTDRVGRLAEVGAEYIVLRSPDGVSHVMCDLASIKFATIITPADEEAVLIM